MLFGRAGSNLRVSACMSGVPALYLYNPFRMCGFAGVVTWDDRYRVSPETLAKMSAAVAHRGPDGEGSYINHQEQVTSDRPQVALAFRRLAILDPDPRSNQPFTDGRFWLVFNGEIYNFRELRKELTSLRPDYPWRTTGDTEVLLCAFAVWGEKCVEHLNGMFAFVVWDEREKSLFLARDRMGQKPLYFATPREGCGRGFPTSTIAFASEPNPFRLIPWFDESIQLDAISDYLRWGYVPSGCVFQWLFRFNPGGWWTFQQGDWKSGEIYFHPNSLPPTHPFDDPAGRTRSLVCGAVKQQLVADVPLGCFLSGGMDSSVIAAAMKANAAPGQNVHTFSIGFNDPRYDETSYAAAVASYLGTEHKQFTVHPRAAADLPHLAAMFGEPFADSSALPTYYLSQKAREHVKVALSGDGGDELFGGYDRYRAVSLERQFSKVPTFFRRILAGASAIPFGSTHPKSMTSRIRRFLRSIDRPVGARYLGYLHLFDEHQLNRLWLNDRQPSKDKKTAWLASLGIHPKDDSLEAQFEELLADHDPVEAALALDRVTYLPGDLLTKVDRCSMMHGLEVRSPFMDHELVQFAAGLTTDQLLKGGPKRMLREAFAADLPAWVFKRKKMGFAVPIGQWFRGELRPMLRDSLFAADSFASGNFNKTVVQRLVDEHEQQRVDHSQRLYALLMLELWWNTVKK